MPKHKPDLLEKLQSEKPEVYQDMLVYIKTHTIEETAQHFAPIIEDDPVKLKYKLDYYSSKYKLQKAEEPKKLAKEESLELTVDETQFLDDFRVGKVTFEAVQREFAFRVMKKIFSNPKLLRAADWLKSELIKIKREELSLKQVEMEANWVKLFGGFMPPKVCPQCGHEIPIVGAVPLQTDELKIINGEEDAKPMGVATSIQQSPS
jgi:hypothetical protein